MEIQLLYFDGCPNWEATNRHLEEALRVVGRAGAHVLREKVETPEEAERRQFRGSPTVLIDRRDPFGGEGPAGLSCRVYPTEDGSPSVAQLVNVLRGVEPPRGEPDHGLSQ